MKSSIVFPGRAIWLCSFALTLVLLPLAALAQTTYYWSGAMTDMKWELRRNWIGNKIPAASQTSTIILSADQDSELDENSVVGISTGTTVATANLVLEGFFHTQFYDPTTGAQDAPGEISIHGSLTTTGSILFGSKTKLLMTGGADNSYVPAIIHGNSAYSDSSAGRLELPAFGPGYPYSGLIIRDEVGTSVEDYGIILTKDFSVGSGGLMYDGGFVKIAANDTGGTSARVLRNSQVTFTSGSMPFFKDASFLELNGSAVWAPANWQMSNPYSNAIPPLRVNNTSGNSSTLNLGTSLSSAQTLYFKDSSAQTWSGRLYVEASALFGKDPGVSSGYQLVYCKLTSSQLSSIRLKIDGRLYLVTMDPTTYLLKKGSEVYY